MNDDVTNNERRIAARLAVIDRLMERAKEAALTLTPTEAFEELEYLDRSNTKPGHWVFADEKALGLSYDERIELHEYYKEWLSIVAYDTNSNPKDFSESEDLVGHYVIREIPSTMYNKENVQ